MIQPANEKQEHLLQRLHEAIREQAEVTRLIREQGETQTVGSATRRAQRLAAWAKLRGTVTYHDDIVAPLGINWDAAG